MKTKLWIAGLLGSSAVTTMACLVAFRPATALAAHRASQVNVIVKEAESPLENFEEPKTQVNQAIDADDEWHELRTGLFVRADGDKVWIQYHDAQRARPFLGDGKDTVASFRGSLGSGSVEAMFTAVKRFQNSTLHNDCVRSFIVKVTAD